jgi:hypothetical protein
MCVITCHPITSPYSPTSRANFGDFWLREESNDRNAENAEDVEGITEKLSPTFSAFSASSAFLPLRDLSRSFLSALTVKPPRGERRKFSWILFT